MICKDCGEEMKLTDMPQAVFTIPFTGGRFCIWDWNKKEWFCSQCAIDSESRKHQEMIDSVAESVGRQAYEEGFADGRA